LLKGGKTPPSAAKYYEIRTIWLQINFKKISSTVVFQWFVILLPRTRTFAALSLFIVNIFVGNLAWGVDDVALQEAFEAHGEVERAKVIHDRETGRSRGFGFVEMPNQEEAEAALEAMEGKELMGREIRCNESEARERR
jgi:hypothetical protein